MSFQTDILRPSTPQDLAATLREAADGQRRIRLGGAFSKDGMAGPVGPSDVCISTTGLSRVLQYEPKDLTISVESGMPWSHLISILRKDGQMVPLDPPFFEDATVGGVLAANTSGPRRRLYGACRDAVIGMTFAMLDGRLIQSGGMVVKNVAGLDMGKLMIGSFGTLAAIASANFKLTPIPVSSRTWIYHSETLEDAIARRNQILRSVLQPAAIDLLNPAGSDRVGLKGYSLLIQTGGVPAVLDRYDRELADAAKLSEADADKLWISVREFVPGFLRECPAGAVLRFSTTIGGVADVLRKHREPALSRAGSGVTWVCIEQGATARAEKDSVIEFAPSQVREAADLWPSPGSSFGMMKKVKELFDPKGLLNPGRMYGRL